MKVLYIVLSRLFQYYRKNKLIFILFIIGGISSSLAVAYFYGNGSTYMANRSSEEFYYREYEVYFRQNGEHYGEKEGVELASVKEGLELIDQELIEKVFFGVDISLEEYRDGYKTRLFSSTEETYLVAIRGRVYFMPEEEWSIIIPSDSKFKIGDTVNINGHGFEVIGQQTFNDYYIPYSAYEKLQLPVSDMVIISEKRPDYSEDQLLIQLQEVYPDSHIRSPWLWRLNERNEAVAAIIIIAVCYAVSITSFMFLFKYMIDSISDETVIFLIVGGSKTEMSLMLFWETILLSLFSNGIGIGLHKLLYTSVFEKLNIAENIVYTLADYSIICLVMLVTSLIVVIPFVIRYYRKSLIDTRRMSVR